MFLVSLYIALFIFVVGVTYKISTWFRYSLDLAAVDITPTKRIAAATKGIWLTLLSAKALTLLKVLIVDVLLQISAAGVHARPGKLHFRTAVCRLLFDR
jgi:hypothetical protein